MWGVRFDPSVHLSAKAECRALASAFDKLKGPEQMESKMEDRWLSVDEIAAYLGVKRDTVYKWIAEKYMPAHRMGRLWKFRKEEVDKWVKSAGKIDSTSSRSMTDSLEGSPQARNEILTLLKKHSNEIRRRFSVRKIGLFGSHAHGGFDDLSDIDLLVELEAPTFDHYMELKFFLEDTFNRPVDLILADSVKPRLKPLIAAEVVYV